MTCAEACLLRDLADWLWRLAAFGAKALAVILGLAITGWWIEKVGILPANREDRE